MRLALREIVAAFAALLIAAATALALLTLPLLLLLVLLLLLLLLRLVVERPLVAHRLRELIHLLLLLLLLRVLTLLLIAAAVLGFCERVPAGRRRRPTTSMESACVLSQVRLLHRL